MDLEKIEFKYNGCFEEVITLEKLRDKVFINAIAITSTVAHAALEIGVSETSVFNFIHEKGLTTEDCWKIRIEFKQRKIKVKRRYYGTEEISQTMAQSSRS